VYIIAVHSENDRIIVNPEFDGSDADYLSLHKIERTDTATIIYADVYNLPNYWVLISSGVKLKDSKGKHYKLLNCAGFELDSKVFMPESGSMSFALYFEPVDKSEKEVDIIDLDENKESVTGVKLYNVKHDEPVQCILKGEVLNRPQSSRLILLKKGEIPRTVKGEYISIHDGKFEYPLYTGAEEAWQLIFYDDDQRGSWRSTDFIAESGTCHFTLNRDDEWRNNSVRGGKYNNVYCGIIDSLRKTMDPYSKTLEEKMDSLYKENKYYSPEMSEIYKEMEHLPSGDPRLIELYDLRDKLEKEGKDKTREASDLTNEMINIYRTMYADKLMEYAQGHADIAGYTFLLGLIRDAMGHNHYRLDVTPMFSLFHDVYEPEYPDHPYTATIKKFMQAAAVGIGKPCPDIVMDDGEGNEVRLYELIKGKVALVHLWASWCGPCRRHGREMIPVYEKYKDKGFTVVSIAREQKKESMTEAAKQDGYPWANFLELDGKNRIWTTFGIEYYAGGDFLIDVQGNFIDIMTSPQKVEDFLSKLFD
jgi:thiol-disulfide isomerase/thioredoxin